MGLGLFLLRSPSGRTWVGHDGGMPGHITALLTHRESGTGGIVLMSNTAGPDPAALAIELADRVVEDDCPSRTSPGARARRCPRSSPACSAAGTPRDAASSSRVREGRLEARHGRRSGVPTPRRCSRRRAPTVYRTESGRERGELLRVTRDADGRGRPRCTGRRTSSPASRSASASTCARCAQALTTSTRTRRRVADRLVEHGPARVGHGQPRLDHGHARSRGSASTSSTAAWSPPVTSGPRRQDPRRVVGGGLVGLSRLVVAAPGEPLLALAARLGPPLHVPLPDLVLDHLLARHPGHGEPALADQQHAPLPRRPRRPPRTPRPSAGPSYAASNGSRASNVDPSSAVPSSAPSRASYVVGPWRVSKFATQRSTREAGTETVTVSTTSVVQVLLRGWAPCPTRPPPRRDLADRHGRRARARGGPDRRGHRVRRGAEGVRPALPGPDQQLDLHPARPARPAAGQRHRRAGGGDLDLGARHRPVPGRPAAARHGVRRGRGRA